MICCHTHTHTGFILRGSAKRKAIFVEVASTHRDDQKALLDLLTKTDCTEKVSESSEALNEGGKKCTVPKFCVTKPHPLYKHKIKHSQNHTKHERQDPGCPALRTGVVG